MQHNVSSTDSFTSKHRPWELRALFFVGESESEAIRLEKFIKKQKSRLFLEKLCEADFKPTGALAQLVRVPYVRD